MIKTLSLGAATLGVATLLTWFTPNDKLLGDVLMLFALFACVNFTFWYATKSRWKILNVGRSLLYVFLALDFVLLQNSLSIWIGTEYYGRQVFRVMMYFSIIVAVIEMSFVLWRIQKRAPTPLPPGIRYLDEVDLRTVNMEKKSI